MVLGFLFSFIVMFFFRQLKINKFFFILLKKNFTFQESVSHLSRENELLRANVNPEILANLSNRQQCIPPDTEPGQY